MRLLVVAAFLVVHLLLPTAPCGAQAAAPPRSQPFSHEQERHKANENLIVGMAGALGSSYLQLADDIAVVVNNRDNLRVVPAIGSGEAASVRDVLLVRGVDLAITSLQVLDMLKASGELGPGLDKQIAYIAPLSVEVFHLLAGAGIDSVQQLKGKKVAFGLKDSGAARFGPGLLKAVGVELAEPGAHSHIAPGDAAHAIRSGNVDAALYSGPLPIPSLAEVKPGTGFKLLELNYVPALERTYLPASISSEHYPHLIAKGERVQSVAGSMVLITFNWPPGSERYRRVEKFITAFFANADKLKLAPRHPAWHGVNMAATIRGWQRFPAAQEWLDRQAAATVSLAAVGIDLTVARAQARRAAPGNASEQERLVKEYVEWVRRQHRPTITMGAAALGIDLTVARAQARRAAPGNASEQERLVREYVEWVHQQQSRLTTTARAAAIGVDLTLVRAQARRAAPGNASEQERLVKEYVEWVGQQKR